MLNKIYNSIVNILISLIFIVILIEISVTLYMYNEYLVKERIRSIYKQLTIASGQMQDALPLVISDEEIDNAYNDGTQVVVYMGLINHMSTWDEVALVLGHEIAHGMLGHLRVLKDDTSADEIAVLEGNADKMGAFYMMKSGYDICKGRKLFEYWGKEHGDALGQDHPDNSYRYHQLNINCGEY